MQSRDTSGKVVCRIKKCRIAVGDFNGTGEKFLRDIPSPVNHTVQFIQKFHGFFRPAGPVSQKSAFDPQFFVSELIFRNQVNKKIIVIAGIKNDIIPSGLSRRAHDIQRAIAVERSHFNRKKIVDCKKFAPEFIGQTSAADTRLKIKADQRHDFRHFSAMGKHFINGRILERGKRQQNGIVIAGAFKLSFTQSLFRFTADTADLDDFFVFFSTVFINELAGFSQNSFKKSDFRIADGKLRGVNSDSDTADTCINKITAERPLMTGRKFAVFIQCKHLRRNNGAFSHSFKNNRINI